MCTSQSTRGSTRTPRAARTRSSTRMEFRCVMMHRPSGAAPRPARGRDETLSRPRARRCLQNSDPSSAGCWCRWTACHWCAAPPALGRAENGTDAHPAAARARAQDDGGAEVSKTSPEARGPMSPGSLRIFEAIKAGKAAPGRTEGGGGDGDGDGDGGGGEGDGGGGDGAADQQTGTPVSSYGNGRSLFLQF